MNSSRGDLYRNIETKFPTNFTSDTMFDLEKPMLHELNTSFESFRIGKMYQGRKTPFRRQFTRPVRPLRRKNQLQPLAQNAFQMSLLLLSILAFGTFVTTSMVKGMKRNNRREASTVIINKTPRMEEVQKLPVFDTDTSFTHWTGIFLQHLIALIVEMSEEWFK